MAKKSEIDNYCKESGYTRSDLKKFFDDAKEVNWIIRKFSEEGRKWSDLPIYQIKELPGLKERTLENIKKHEEEQAKLANEKENAKKQKKYYEENFEEIMLKKILAKEELTEKELSRLVFEYEVESKEIDELRWTFLTETIVELCGKVFKIEWQRAKTEMQEHVFMNQPIEIFEDELSAKTEEIMIQIFPSIGKSYKVIIEIDSNLEKEKQIDAWIDENLKFVEEWKIV